MHSRSKPDLDSLPSKKSLLRSTLIAAAAAVVIAFTIVLPAEYGIDPTGVGRIVGLTQMGEIKVQLAEEAEIDRQQGHDSEDQSKLFDHLLNLFVGTAHAQDTSNKWNDEVIFTLAPGEGTEIKLTMQENAEVQFQWAATGGLINYDLHGHGSGQKISYKKGRGVPEDEGTLSAKFTGNHGWFWRNRDKQEITVTLRLRGQYEQLKHVE